MKPAQLGAFFCWLLLLTVFSIAAAKQRCKFQGQNLRRLDKIIDHFNKEIDAKYVGQQRAVKAVRRELEEKINLEVREPVVLHFVGPSGTGKSFLAQITATSIFNPVNCAPKHEGLLKTSSSATGAVALAAQVGLMANPLAAMAASVGGAALGLLTGYGINSLVERTCVDASELDNWLLTCGIVHRSFNEAGEEEAMVAMKSVLERAAEELLREPRTVVILDDFNYCIGQCEKMLKDALLHHTLTTAAGEKVSTKDATIILTSDLTYLGLEIPRGESYETALEAVEAAAHEHWGKSSMILTAAHLIPFAPLSDVEIIKVVDRMISQTGDNVRLRIEQALRQEEAKRRDRSLRWTGKFVCSERTKMQIVDHMHETIERKNSRAVTEELKALIRRILREPVTVERRLLRLPQKAMGKRGSMFAKSGVYFDQDITLVYVRDDPRHFIRLVLDDEEDELS